jgi:hypothetical protein
MREQDEPTARNFRTRKGRLVDHVRLSGVFKANHFQRAGLAFAIEANPRNPETHIPLRRPHLTGRSMLNDRDDGRQL